MFSKFAAKWLHTVTAWLNVRLCRADDGSRVVDDLLALENQLQNIGGDVGIDKPSAKEVSLRAERPFHVPDDKGRNADVASAQDPGLGCCVEQLIRLHA